MDKEKRLMRRACTFNEKLNLNHGVISAYIILGMKEVHLKHGKFFEMFDKFEMAEYGDEYNKVFVKDGDTEFFALIEREV